MEQYYLIGSPVAHSLSPLIHNTAFSACGISAAYGLIETGVGTLADTVEDLRSHAAGWNVTMPCKNAMCALCDELSLAARIGGSVNTVKNDHGTLRGYTTDGSGLFSALEQRNIVPEGKRLVLLGTGGAASAILIEAALRQASEISVFYNRPSSALHIRDIAGKLKEHSKTGISLYSYEEEDRLKNELKNASLLINATNVGMEGSPHADDCLIPDAGYLQPPLFVCDIIYHPMQTPLLKLAASAGLACENGLAMLIGQAAASFHIWTGTKMPLDLVTNTVKASL